MGIFDKIIKKDGKEKDNETTGHGNDLSKEKTKEEENESSKKKAVDSSKKESEAKKDKKKKIIAKENTPLEHFEILQKPHISEKAFYFGKQNKYVFRVLPASNKTEIGKAVENIYGVSVKSVNIINIPPKRKMFRGKPGMKNGYKKAIVKLKKGDSIDMIEGA